MIFDKDIKKLIKELEVERDKCSPDKYGYVEADVYEKVIKRLNELVLDKITDAIIKRNINAWKTLSK